MKHQRVAAGIRAKLHYGPAFPPQRERFTFDADLMALGLLILRGFCRETSSTAEATASMLLVDGTHRIIRARADGTQNVAVLSFPLRGGRARRRGSRPGGWLADPR